MLRLWDWKALKRRQLQQRVGSFQTHRYAHVSIHAHQQDELVTYLYAMIWPFARQYL